MGMREGLGLRKESITHFMTKAINEISLTPPPRA